MLEIGLVAFKEPDDHRVGRRHIYLPPVHTQKHIDAKKGGPLVSIYKWVVNEYRLEQCSSHLKHILVVASLRSIESAFQQARIADACWAAESRD